MDPPHCATIEQGVMVDNGYKHLPHMDVCPGAPYYRNLHTCAYCVKNGWLCKIPAPKVWHEHTVEIDDCWTCWEKRKPCSSSTGPTHKIDLVNGRLVHKTIEYVATSSQAPEAKTKKSADPVETAKAAVSEAGELGQPSGHLFTEAHNSGRKDTVQAKPAEPPTLTSTSVAKGPLATAIKGGANTALMSQATELSISHLSSPSREKSTGGHEPLRGNGPNPRGSDSLDLRTDLSLLGKRKEPEAAHEGDSAKRVRMQGSDAALGTDRRNGSPLSQSPASNRKNVEDSTSFKTKGDGSEKGKSSKRVGEVVPLSNAAVASEYGLRVGPLAHPPSPSQQVTLRAQLDEANRRADTWKTKYAELKAENEKLQLQRIWQPTTSVITALEFALRPDFAPKPLSIPPRVERLALNAKQRSDIETMYRLGCELRSSTYLEGPLYFLCGPLLGCSSCPFDECQVRALTPLDDQYYEHQGCLACDKASRVCDMICSQFQLVSFGQSVALLKLSWYDAHGGPAAVQRKWQDHIAKQTKAPQALDK